MSDAVVAHLQTTYGIDVARLSRLDQGVYRVDRRDGDPWVARVFPTARPRAVVDQDAGILQSLEQAGFPAERCADPAPVSELDGSAVLVTTFLSGGRPPERARTYAVLGALLGRLHRRSAASLRVGGAWHHLCPQGDPRDEKAAVLALLDQSRDRTTDARSWAAVRAEAERVDDCADLPHSFVHPDFVTANAIATPGDSLSIVDWAGSGRGPRLWSLGFLLWAAGHHDLRLVDWVVSRYRRHVQLEPEELTRLPGAIRGRPLMLTSWMMCQGLRPAARVAGELATDAERAGQIADRARQAFASA